MSLAVMKEAVRSSNHVCYIAALEMVELFAAVDSMRSCNGTPQEVAEFVVNQLDGRYREFQQVVIDEGIKAMAQLAQAGVAKGVQDD